MRKRLANPDCLFARSADEYRQVISSQTAFAFFLASVLLALTPGPDKVFVLMHSALSGWRAGILVIFGLCTRLKNPHELFE
jgi:hypothetical protein